MSARLYHCYDNQWNNVSKWLYSLNTHIQPAQLRITKRQSALNSYLSFRCLTNWLSDEMYSICKLHLEHFGICILFISYVWPSRCRRSLPLHAHQPGQPPLSCAHADPWPGERSQSLALSQEPRPRGPEGGRARQQDGVWDLPDEATSNEGAIYYIYCSNNMLFINSIYIYIYP